jgi:integrase
MGLTEKTKESYQKLIKDWLTFIAMTPTEQINKRMHDLTSTDILQRTFFEDKFREYKASLESTGLNSDTKVHDRLKVVSSFFTRNSLPLALKKGDWNSTQTQLVTEKKAKLSLDDVKRLYGHANLRDKCLLLILGQSGFSETDISELKIEDINGLYSMPINEHYVIEKRRNKSNHVQATCLSYEFLHDLRQLLSESGNPTQGYIFTSKTVNQGLKPIDTRRINEIIKDLYIKTFGIDKAKLYQTRTLRSFYNGALLAVKPSINCEIKDLMMGHDRQGARNNYQYNDETIKDAYISAFDNLSINGLQSRNDLVAIKETIKQRDDFFTSIITELKTENNELKTEQTEIKAMLNKILSAQTQNAKEATTLKKNLKKL